MPYFLSSAVLSDCLFYIGLPLTSFFQCGTEVFTGLNTETNYVIVNISIKIKHINQIKINGDW